MPAAAAAFPGNAREHGSRGGGDRRGRPRTSPRSGAAPCIDWNLKRGACTSNKSCPSGRVHFCAICVDKGLCQCDHRGVDRHSHDEVYRACGRAPPKGKGRGKGHGKNKKGKNNDHKANDAAEKR